MSGLVAVVRFDGGPVDRALFDGLLDKIRYRGPDGDGVWIGDGAALGHTLFATSTEQRNELQPVDRDRLVVVLDGRIDGRGDLAQALRMTETTPDPELLLRAFAAWGEETPRRIIGDFAFAVWSRTDRRLFVARDRAGVRPLYYAHLGETLVVTNDLAALIGTGDLASALDDSAIADFLLFAQGLDLARTSYARIARIPPGHFAVFGEHGVRLQRYWSVPVADGPRTISEADAVEEFRDVFARAVADRTRGACIAISLSGGVDSTAVAATLARIKPGAAGAVTAGYERLIEDHEPRFAARAAAWLGIPWHFVAADDHQLFERWDDPRCRGLEPVETPLRVAFIDLMRHLGERGRVLLTGQGGDAVLYTSHRYFIDLLRRGRIDRLAREALGYAISRRRLPPLLFRSHLLRALRLASDAPPFPRWVRPEVEKRLALRDRWREQWSWRSRREHPWRGEAALFTTQPLWPNAFQSYDVAWTGVPIELTVPFFDARVVEFLFSLPPMPHFADKDIVRRAMAGSLPDDVRLRPKTTLRTDPAELLLRREGDRWLSRLNDSPITSYVDARILAEVVRSAIAGGRSLQREIPPIALAMWMAYR